MLDTLVAIADNAVLRITPIINAIVAASLIIFVGFIGGKILGKFILRLLKDSYVDETTKKITKKEIKTNLRGPSFYFIACLMCCLISFMSFQLIKALVLQIDI